MVYGLGYNENQFCISFGSSGLSLKGHWVIWVNKYDLVVTLVENNVYFSVLSQLNIIFCS